MKTHICFLFSIIFCLKGFSQTTLPLNGHTQDATHWCWASASKSVLDYFGPDLTQCEIAEWARTQNTSYFGINTCCSSTGTVEYCNYGNSLALGNGSMKDILEHFASINSTYSIALTFAEVKQKINWGLPFYINIAYPGVIERHVMVGIGYEDPDIVKFIDPDDGLEDFKVYSELYSNSDYSWENSLWIQLLTCSSGGCDDEGTACSITPTNSCVYIDGTTCTSTPTLTSGNSCGVSGLNNSTPDIWYTFVATSSCLSPTINVQSGINFDAVVEVYDGIGGSQIGLCSDDTQTGGLETINLTSLTVGQTYYVRIYNYWGTMNARLPQGQDFQICVTCTDPCGTPTNDHRYSAPVSTLSATELTIHSACEFTNGSTCGASEEIGPSTCSPASLAKDVWYTFTALASTATIKVESIDPGFWADVELLNDNTLAGSITCLSAVAPGAVVEITCNTLIAGNTYYIRVYDKDGNANGTEFKICVYGDESSTNCAGSGTAPDNNETPYLLSVPTSCSSTSFTNGNTCNATQTFTPGGCGGSAQALDVWYSFTPENTSATIKTKAIDASATGIDIVVQLFSSLSSAYSMSCSNSTAAGGEETISRTDLVAGTTYYVRVFDANENAYGTEFSICVFGPAAGAGGSGFLDLYSCNTCISQGFAINGQEPGASNEVVYICEGVPILMDYCVGFPGAGDWLSYYFEFSQCDDNLTTVGTAVSHEVFVHRDHYPTILQWHSITMCAEVVGLVLEPGVFYKFTLYGDSHNGYYNPNPCSGFTSYSRYFFIVPENLYLHDRMLLANPWLGNTKYVGVNSVVIDNCVAPPDALRQVIATNFIEINSDNGDTEIDYDFTARLSPVNCNEPHLARRNQHYSGNSESDSNTTEIEEHIVVSNTKCDYPEINNATDRKGKQNTQKAVSAYAVEIFPNPNQGNFQLFVSNSIKSSETKECKLSILNILGAEIFHHYFLLNAEHSKIEVDLTDQPAGIYFLNLCTPDETFNKRIIIQN